MKRGGVIQGPYRAHTEPTQSIDKLRCGIPVVYINCAYSPYKCIQTIYIGWSACRVFATRCAWGGLEAPACLECYPRRCYNRGGSCVLNRPEFDPGAATKVEGWCWCRSEARLSVARWSCRRWKERLRERVTPGTSAEVVNSLMSSERASVEVNIQVQSTIERSWRTGPP